MFDIGWQELFLVAVVTILVVGPKELPRVLRSVTLGVRRIRAMASDFQSSVDDLAREADLDDLRKDLEKSADFDLESELEDAIDPTGEVTESLHELGGELNDDPDIDAAAETFETDALEAESQESQEGDPESGDKTATGANG